MSRYAVYVKIVVEADNAKEARETVDSELEDVIPFESHDVQNVKKDEAEDDEPEGEDDIDVDPDM